MGERLVAIIGYSDTELLEIACFNTTLGMANEIGQLTMPYHVVVVSPGGRPVVCAPRAVLQSDRALEGLTGPLDTLLVAGGLGYARAAASPLIVTNVQRLARASRRIASVCTGAGVLAAAGLLDGKRATTHWWYADRFAADYPNVTVDPDPVYIRDGNVITAAGITSALDLALAFVEEDHGPELARMLARMLVTYMHRPGNQAQMSIFTAAPPPKHDVVRRVVEHVNTHLAADLSTAALAKVAGVSSRHLTRLLLTHAGVSPGRFVRNARAAAAAQLLASTSIPLPDVAARCGLGSTETMRRAFVDRYDISPSRYRSIHTGRASTPADKPSADPR